MATKGVVWSMRNMLEPWRSTSHMAMLGARGEGDKCKDLAPESILELTLDDPLIGRQFFIFS